MKIFTAAQTRELDAQTILSEPIPSLELMERASRACFRWITEHYPSTERFTVIAGPGNNGGDGLAIARMLLHEGFSVAINLLAFSSSLSKDCASNLEGLRQLTADVNVLRETSDQLEILDDSIIIDAIFGNGLNRNIADPFALYIDQMNRRPELIIAIDLPSGLNAERSMEPLALSVNADITLTFEYPKVSMLFPENADRVGVWHIVNIHLCSQTKNYLPTNNYYITTQYIRKILKNRSKFSHKGIYGHALIIAGSHGKMGAAILSAKACLRAGVGLLTMHIPACGYSIMQIAVPEAMVELNMADYFLKGTIHSTADYSLGVGPGIGQHVETSMFLYDLLKASARPMVFDADAINILAANKSWLVELPALSIFTPHPKEFSRLVGPFQNDEHKLALQRLFSKQHQCYVVLKGAHTSISDPEGNIFFNSTGNPGMATAGSGDVLTGIITALLAQGYKPLAACQIGVFVHGMAGDLAAKEKSASALIASDIIDYLGEAWKHL